MTPEVKERIDQIRRGIVPEGYIKSKDGIYPGDWTSKKIGQWLQPMERPISLEDEEKYELVTVRRRFGGVDSRGTYWGKNVLVKNYFGLRTGDFVISKRQIAHGACGVVPVELDGAVVSNEYNVFIPQEGTNINMFNLMMQLPHYRRLFYLMSDGVHIEKLLFKTDDWMRRSLAMPSLEEQEKIASILTMQDKIIELEQQKIEEIKKARRFFLEKMFPKEGQTVPEIRFKGFTDPWEQRKFEEIAVRSSAICSDVNLPRVEYEDIVSGAGRLNNDIYAKQSSKSGVAFHQGDVLYGKLRPYLQNWLLPTFDGIAVGDFWVLQPQNADSSFLYRLIQSRQFDEVANQSTGTKMPRADWKLVSKTVFSIPSNISEQAAIGTFFSALDSLITLHQRKLEEEKNKKKALMQLLLTGIVRV